ncbi:hypothetical protein FOZ61_005011 [Perkinsus olseni]|uniref:Uncharacterized protein n=1 Tax=Perkinsus olseni TaxID=32597 RepID=A0A7J6LJL6_PEROL|nr:hypothetical protein FOZ61_005011 [Perkinsus olseni]
MTSETETEYWTISTGVACRNGWSCRECKGPIVKGTPLVCRDGRKLRFMYHPKCFSGYSDVRTQPANIRLVRLASSSIVNWLFVVSSALLILRDIQGKYPNLSREAPKEKGHGKWSTSCGYVG